MTQENKLIIASRESPLALWQTKHVQSVLKEKFPELDVEILGITTKGDKRHFVQSRRQRTFC